MRRNALSLNAERVPEHRETHTSVRRRRTRFARCYDKTGRRMLRSQTRPLLRPVVMRTEVKRVHNLEHEQWKRHPSLRYTTRMNQALQRRCNA